MIASKKNDIDAFEMLYQVETQFEQGRFKEGIKILEAIRENFPDFGPTYNHLGWLYSTQFNDYSTAKFYFEKALELDPDYPHSYFNFAALLRNLRQYQQVKDLLIRATNIPTVNTAKAYGELGLTYELQEDYQAAESSYREAIKLSIHLEDLSQFRLGLERCFLKRDILNIGR